VGKQLLNQSKQLAVRLISPVNMILR